MIWKPGEYQQWYPEIPGGGEWGTSDNPFAMLDGFCRVQAPRVRRLFAVAVTRYVCESIGKAGSRQRLRAVLAIVERYADGRTPWSEVVNAARQLPGEGSGGFQGYLHAAAGWCCSPDHYRCVQVDRQIEWTLDTQCLNSLGLALEYRGDQRYVTKSLKVFCGLVQDIFGSPFQRVSFEARWLTDAARALAISMYESRVFDSLPVLADALEEAGCTDQTILKHCRESSVHARGCWVLDFILGYRKPVAGNSQ